MKTQSKSKQVKITEGLYNIAWISSTFKENFGNMKATKVKSNLEYKVLPRYMNDRDIISELKPSEVTLGDFANALENNSHLLKNGYANIFYIRNSENILWAVYARWYGGGWCVLANSVEDPFEWSGGGRVLSRDFGSKDLNPVKSFDPSVLGYLEEIEELIKKIKSKIDENQI